MHINCLRRDTGSAGKAAGYLVGERDATGRERDSVEVLRGDPDIVAAVADSLEFEHKYRSTVIAWAPEDRPTDAQVNAVLDEFEKTASAGLDADRYSWTAVAAPRAGRRRSCARADRTVRPGDGQEPETSRPPPAENLRPAARHVQPRARLEPAGRPGAGEGAAARPSRLHRGGEACGTGLEHEADPRELIQDYLTQRVEYGAVQSRADVVAALEEARLEVPRQGKSYLTVRNPDDGKRWRLKGAFVRA